MTVPQIHLIINYLKKKDFLSEPNTIEHQTIPFTLVSPHKKYLSNIINFTILMPTKIPFSMGKQLNSLCCHNSLNPTKGKHQQSQFLCHRTIKSQMINYLKTNLHIVKIQNFQAKAAPTMPQTQLSQLTLLKGRKNFETIKAHTKFLGNGYLLDKDAYKL